jgi:hypothetical protein
MHSFFKYRLRSGTLVVLLFIGVFFVLPVAPAFSTVSFTDQGNLMKALEKQGKRGPKRSGPLATGSQQLIDSSGLQWFINTNITFSTSSSASGAMSEASYTRAVAATTLNGGTVSSTLNDAYDGYGAMCISLTGATGPCETGNADYVIYNKNGTPTQTSGNLSFYRKVLIPDNDAFARWLNFFTNTGTSTITFNVIYSNNLGSDSNTVVVTSSNGNNAAELTDSWVTTFQNYSGTTSSDPRLGHVLQGTGKTSLSNIFFADGNDNPYWAYTVTLNPGETKAIMTFGVAQPSKAAAAAKSAELANLANPTNDLQCMSTAEKAQVINFNTTPPVAHPVPSVNKWGIVIFMLAVGCVSVYYLRRRSVKA